MNLGGWPASPAPPSRAPPSPRSPTNTFSAASSASASGGGSTCTSSSGPAATSWEVVREDREAERPRRARELGASCAATRLGDGASEAEGEGGEDEGGEEEASEERRKRARREVEAMAESPESKRQRFLDRIESEAKQPGGLSREMGMATLSEHPEALGLLRIAENRRPHIVAALAQAEVDTIDDLVVWARGVHSGDESFIKPLTDAGLNVAFLSKLKDFYERCFPQHETRTSSTSGE